MPQADRDKWLRVLIVTALVAVAVVAYLYAPLRRAPAIRAEWSGDGAEPGGRAGSPLEPRASWEYGRALEAVANEASGESDGESLPDAVEAFRYNHATLLRLTEPERRRALVEKVGRIVQLSEDERRRLRLEDLSEVDFKPRNELQAVMYWRWLDLDRTRLLHEALIPALNELAATGAHPELWDAYVCRLIHHCWAEPTDVLAWIETYLWSFVPDSGAPSPEPVLLILRALAPDLEEARQVLIRLAEVDWIPLNRKATYCGELAAHVRYSEFAPKVLEWLEKQELEGDGAGGLQPGLAWVGVETLRSYGAKREKLAKPPEDPDEEEEALRAERARERDAIPEGAAFTSLLIPKLEACSERTEVAAVEAIAAFGGEFGRRHLIGRIADGDEHVGEILVALANHDKLFPEDVLPWLGHAEIGETAVFVLHYLVERDPSLYPHLTDVAFGEFPPSQRSSAYVALANLNAQSARATADLLRGLELEREPTVLATILDCLGRQGTDQLETMRRVAADAGRFEDGVRQLAWLEALRLTGKSDDPAAIPSLLAQMARDSGPTIRAQGGLFLGAYAVANPGVNGPTEWDDAFDAWMKDPPIEVLDLIGIEQEDRNGAALALSMGMGREEIRAGISHYLEGLRHPDVLREHRRWQELLDVVDEAGIQGFHEIRRTVDFNRMILDVIGTEAR